MHQEHLFANRDARVLPPRSIWKLRRYGIFLGTSGYSYDDWVGPFYRHGTPKAAMLDYYRHFFPTVELNYTYYTMPRPSTLFQIRNKAPQMQFSVKAHQSMTHQRRGLRQSWQDFADAMTVLSDTGQLTCLLFQFPFSFKYNEENSSYVEDLIVYFDLFHVVLEFRHASWHSKSIYRRFATNKVCFCSIDAPRLPGLTSNVLYRGKDVAYYRLHGRNARNWFVGDNVTRYDYRYGETEIRDIVENIIALAEAARHVFIYANNHPRAQAVETAVRIAEALDQHAALATLQP
ncbi:MAG: DUF72 domain-containing protein [Bacteroidetes bacterium]|nr:DUF72 domain-containing protein [Bacteroidota bacterium]